MALLKRFLMTWIRFVLMLYFFMVAHKAVCQTLLMLNRWTEYCTELYNHMANGDQSVLDCVSRQTQRMTTPSFAEKWRLQYNH